MNSIDAGAKRIDVQFHQREKIVIEDDGRGFQSLEEVHTHFGCFGFDHNTEKEQAFNRQLGRFGLGRGQILAFGRTTWETNRWSMNVDIQDKKELEFQITEHDKHLVRGCRITAELYEPLKQVQLMLMIDELKQQIRYAPVEVHINGERVSTRPDEVKWTTETEMFRFKASTNSEEGITVYNLGIYVRGYHYTTMGVSGELVSKPGHPFELNTARNDVLQNRCRVWKEAKKLLGRETAKHRAKGRLNQHDRNAILRELRYGEAEPETYKATPLFKTIHGRHVSAVHIERNFKGKLTVAPTNHDAQGEQVHRHKMCAVLSPEVLHGLDVSDAGGIAKRLNTIFEKTYPFRHGSAFRAIEFDEACKPFKSKYRIIDQSEWTKTEEAAMRGLDAMNQGICRQIGTATPTGKGAGWRNTRRLLLGEAPHANAWTDGENYITLDRTFVNRHLRRGYNGWLRIQYTFIHEYMHHTDDRDNHMHGPEFLQAVHDLLLSENYDGFAIVMHSCEQYQEARKRLGLKMTRDTARQIDRIEDAAPHNGNGDPTTRPTNHFKGIRATNANGTETASQALPRLHPGHDERQTVLFP